MKFSTAACSMMLCCIALCCLQTSSAPAGSDTPTLCCVSYTARQIPRALVVSYFSTSSKCSMPGIVLVTKRGRKICANPNDPWVQKYVDDLERN